ncbi:phosphate ABC transporter substrate-binding protein PstS [Aristophania vespae]|uniref:phosphate ABC transporter substrate-binding protein PstS n=1 Tax=Aristophania vespae TaxID=2697033 RepID=UPI0023517208|nr:phosphate ABC transporter substrate-binding protein PstS [Aristophania vespae]UMM63954.1 Phosphate-binding protein PstS [Aristophania vespae]
MRFNHALLLKIGLGCLIVSGCVSSLGVSYAQSKNSRENNPHKAAVTVTGAGSSFAAPVYESWGEAAFPNINVHVNYQTIGSSAGQDQVMEGTIDFGASDKPMDEAGLKKAALYQFPTVMSGVVVIVNVPHIVKGTLQLDGPTLAGIYDGTITKWNDASILALNPGLKLPDDDIVPIHRADGSGTSYVFTSYLSQLSSEWKKQIGAGTLVEWPGGAGARGNDGIAALVKQTEGSIGYVEFSYATGNHLDVAKLKNHDGVFIAPTLESLSAASQAADWQNSPNFTVNLLDQAGPNAWPIVSATYALIPQKNINTAEGKGVKSFFQWGLSHGEELNSALGYVGLPHDVKMAILEKWPG